MHAFAAVNTTTFNGLDVGRSFLHIRYVSKFVYEGHWIEVKVTGAKKPAKVESSNSRNVKLTLIAITPVLKYNHEVCVQHVFSNKADRMV